MRPNSSEHGAGLGRYWWLRALQLIAAGAVSAFIIEPISRWLKASSKEVP